jgi:putative transposase
MVQYLQVSYDVSERRACKVVKVPRSVQRYQSIAERHDLLRARIRELALLRHRYGYRRLHILLRREGFEVVKALVYRLYCEEGLVLRPRRPRRHVSAAYRKAPVREATEPNQAWSMDFISDQLQSGNRFRALTIIDVHTRECLADAKDKIATWLKDYNESRPHRALNNLSPLEYVAQLENGA